MCFYTNSGCSESSELMPSQRIGLMSRLRAGLGSKLAE